MYICMQINDYSINLTCDEMEQFGDNLRRQLKSPFHKREDLGKFN